MWKRSFPPRLLKTGSVLGLREGEEIFITYTSAADKIKIFSAYILEGIQSGDAVMYTYPDEESTTVRTRLEEYGVEVKRYEKDRQLRLLSLTENFMPDGRLDYEQAVAFSLNWWKEVKEEGYKHARGIEDFGNFFVNEPWKKYVTDYWRDPRWDDPNLSEWVMSKPVGRIVFKPFIKDVSAINVEHMKETQVTEFLRALGKGTGITAKLAFVDLIDVADSFSQSIGLNHEVLSGRKVLLEFDPRTSYEEAVESLAEESMANAEPIFVFTSHKSPIHMYLAKQPAIKFFLLSNSTSVPKSASEREVLLPVNNVSLILDAVSKILEINEDSNVCFVFDILSELLTSIGTHKAFIFLRYALDMLFPDKTTSLFLLNTSAHKAEVASLIRGSFHNLLTYKQAGIEVIKIS